jgi:hypothetical protein
VGQPLNVCDVKGGPASQVSCNDSVGQECPTHTMGLGIAVGSYFLNSAKFTI